MIYRFGAFELDIAKAEFRENGQLRAIEPQVFGLLAFPIRDEAMRARIARALGTLGFAQAPGG